MKRRVLYSFLLALLAVNLLLGARIYLYSAQAASANDNPYDNYKLLADAMEKVRTEYVDPGKVGYQDLVHAALKGMLASLDPHSEFMDARRFNDLTDDTKGQFGGIGVMVEMGKDKWLTVIAPMMDSPGYRAGILSWDQIIKINNKSTEKMSLEDAVGILRGEPGSHVSVTIYRPSTGQTLPFDLTRSIVKVPTVQDLAAKQEFPLGDNAIGYVRINQFGDDTARDLHDALAKLTGKGMKALILDLRDNPGGLLDQAVKVCEQFLPYGEKIVSTERRDAPPQFEYGKYSGKRVDMPMVILVNSGSASAAEIVTGCLQDDQQFSHAIVVGEQTFGKGSVQSILPLADGSALKLTTAKYFTPSHKVIHERGITPDILVPMSPQDEEELHIKYSPGGVQSLKDEQDRERVLNTHDLQLERAEDLLKGILLVAQHNSTAKRAALK